ncbi:MAG: hypothetical protein ACN4GK_11900 [Acidimicrobiia bacterium]
MRLELTTDPPSVSQVFDLAASFAPTFYLLDGQIFSSGPVEPGPHWVSVVVPPGWDESASCIQADGGLLDPMAFIVEAGDLVSCAFHLVQRAEVSIITTEAGEVPHSGFSFEIRSGATEEFPGVAIAAGSTDDAGSVLLSCTDEVDGEGCLDVVSDGLSGPRFAPGPYQVCETGILPGWDNDLDGFTPGEDDGSTECIDATLAAGTTLKLTVDNTPPPGGLAHQSTFWINWSSCRLEDDRLPVLDETLAMFQGGGTTIGAVSVESCETAVTLLEANASDGTPRSSDPAYLLAAELLAATLNQQAGAFTCDESAAVMLDGGTLLADLDFDGAGWFLDAEAPETAALRELAGAYQQTLLLFNTNQLCDRSESDPVPELLVPILIWPALWLGGRLRRRTRDDQTNGR